jgi:hypothetical protein
MLPRKHYRDVARELSKLTDPAAQAAVQAINDLLEERARLTRRVLRTERTERVPEMAGAPAPAPKRSLRSYLLSRSVS